MREIRETAFNCVDEDNVASFSTQEKKWVNRALKLAEKYPDEVRIVAQNPDGSVCIHLPKSWFRLAPPVKRNLTEEQRQALAERMKKAREKQ